MHYIQKHILDVLRQTESTNYAKLNSNNVESGHFRYHLNQLVKYGYVDQLERGIYKLSESGQGFVDKLSANKVNQISQPKVITYTLLRDGSKILLQRKQKQPYMSLLNMVGGKLHNGEKAHDASVREVMEKTGAKIANPNLKGVFEILINKNDVLLTHAIAYVFMAEVDSTDFDHNKVEVIETNDVSITQDLAPDFLDIFKKIADATSIQVETLELQI